MSLVSYYGLTAVVIWLMIIMRPTEGLSVSCQQCKDQFTNVIKGVEYKDNKERFCSIYENFFVCLHTRKCDPKKEWIDFQNWYNSLKGALLFLCDFEARCKRCMVTFNQQAKNLHSNPDKTSLCRINKQFVKCSDDNDCTKGQLGNRYAPMVAMANATIYFACASDVCHSGPADRCHHFEHMSLNRGATKGMSHEEYRCVMASRFANCIKDNGCEEDPDKEYQMQIYESVLQPPNCQCNTAKADQCLAKEDAKGSVKSISMACLQMRNKMRCVHDNGCSEEGNYGTVLTTASRMIAHFRCPKTAGFASGTNDTIMNDPGKGPKKDDADKKDHDDGSSSCYASWVMVLMVAIGMIGQC